MEKILSKEIAEALSHLYSVTVREEEILIQKTRKEHRGDYTLVLFPL